MRHLVAATLITTWSLAGCRAQVGGAYLGTPPRAGGAPGSDGDIRVALKVDSARTGQLVRAGMSSSGGAPVVIDEVTPEVLEAETKACNDPGCRSALGAACQFARKQGADYYAEATSAVAYDETYKCTHYKLDLFGTDDDECTEGHLENQHTAASFAILIYETATCQEVGALRRSFRDSVAGEREESEPQAEQRLSEGAPRAIADIFPSQVQVGDEVTAGQLYAIFRAGRYLGLVEGGPQLERLSCCFEPEKGDVLVGRGRYWVLDGVIGATALSLESELLFGAGYHIRSHPVDGGLLVGFAIEAAGKDGLGVALGTFEVGWMLRPAPAWALGAAVGAGFSSATREPEPPDPGKALHATAVARATYATRMWIVSLDAGWARSLDYGDDTALSGPLFRLTAGFSL